MSNYVNVGDLQVASELYEFINGEALPGSQVDQNQFWAGFEKIIKDLTPKNKELLAKRDVLQTKINRWHRENKDFNFDRYKAFLEEIGYLLPEPEDFTISTEGADDEIALKAGPQLVVPVDNARYAINAANARWGSLYDALYGTDVISDAGGAQNQGGYNPVRGGKVIEFARSFLDEIIPLQVGTHKEAVSYAIEQGSLTVTLRNGDITTLRNEEKFVGYQGEPEQPTAVLLKNNDNYFEIQIDRSHPIGKTDAAGIKDILLESALTSIMDCEDSVAAVDAQDKVLVYRNWLGLNKGSLSATFTKGNKTLTRTLNPDRSYLSPAGSEFTLPGRALMLVRNVGHLMTNNAILDGSGNEVQEGIIDAVVTSLCAKHSLIGNTSFKNSANDSIYIVKPKMHGPEETAFANELFNRTEDLLGIARNTLKIGVMDEERRTSLNLKACIKEVQERVVFINTGFLDRTGDEMHTSMEAGAMIRKNEMKSTLWLQSYEKSNVNNGLSTGFQGRAQIGKGMWAMPDLMKSMLEQKIGHLQAGGNTAWIPSPTAATLHALHYHQVNVKDVQNNLLGSISDLRDDILQIPISDHTNWSPEEVQAELDNNAQGILGYVVRWVEQGIGCSKVPDINNIALMEDRATLRISSQHVANWLYHGICSKEQVVKTLERMAKVVDEQNAGDPAYRPMADNFEQSVAFQAASDLVFKGFDQPSGYTEPILHSRRLEAKAKYSVRS
jgi:malate synthase